MFNKEGSSGIDVKVPSTSDPEMLVWVNACTDQVQNCHQIAASNSVILRENQSNETSESSREPVAKDVTLIAKGDLEQEHLPSEQRSCPLFHAHEVFQVMRIQVFPNKQPN